MTEGKNVLMPVVDTPRFSTASGSTYEIRDGILFYNGALAEGLFAGTVPTENYDLVCVRVAGGILATDAEPHPTHEEFGGPRLSKYNEIVDLKPYLGVGRIVIRMQPETEGTHWERTDNGVSILSMERWSDNGLLKAYRQISTPIEKKTE